MQWSWMKAGIPADTVSVEDTKGLDPDSYTQSCANDIGPDGIMGKDPMMYDGQWGNGTAHEAGGTNDLPPFTFREKLRLRTVWHTAVALYRIKKFFKRS